jgi:hypothetical protein
VHSAEGFTHDNWWQANSIAGLMKVLEAFHKGSDSSSPLLVSSTKHWDQIYISRFYNWKAGSWKGAYGYAGTYKLKPDAPDADDAVRTLSSFYVPVFEKMTHRRHNRRVRDRPGDDPHHRFAGSVTF